MEITVQLKYMKTLEHCQCKNAASKNGANDKEIRIEAQSL